jgi:hypothetical protein
MKRICYMVTATLPDEATLAEYLAFLEDGHVDAVVSHGAHSAMIVRLEPIAVAPFRVMTQYIFPTRELFDRYLEHFAPALRADGLRRFPPERGVRFERAVGEIV